MTRPPPDASAPLHSPAWWSFALERGERAIEQGQSVAWNQGVVERIRVQQGWNGGSTPVDTVGGDLSTYSPQGYEPSPKGTCRRCLQEKPGSEFTKEPRNRSGLCSWCRSCVYAAKNKRRSEQRAVKQVERKEKKERRSKEKSSAICAFPGCGRSVTRKMWCTEHGKQSSRGDVLRPLQKPMYERVTNPVNIVGDVAYITLFDRTESVVVGVVIVDTKVVTNIIQYRWSKTCSGYAVAREKGSKHQIKMHRLILEAPADYEVDHINGNRLDNRKENLRLVDRNQQAQNVAYSGRESLRGVYYSEFTGLCRADGTRRKRLKPWYAAVMVGGIRRKSKFFATEQETKEEAARMRQQHCTHSVEARHQ